jgi:hypothetical protein
MKSHKVLTKRENYEHWQSGSYGNKLRSWRTVKEWRASGFAGKVALRQLGRGGGGCVYHLDRSTLDAALLNWKLSGVSDEAIMVNEQAPDCLLIQGEYRNEVLVIDGETHHGLFFHSRAHKQMREALVDGAAMAYDHQADLMLRHLMSPSSYDDWLMLIEQYPDHVLEVSVYDMFVGDQPNRNALVWEIRKY